MIVAAAFFAAVAFTLGAAAGVVAGYFSGRRDEAAVWEQALSNTYHGDISRPGSSRPVRGRVNWGGKR